MPRRFFVLAGIGLVLAGGLFARREITERAWEQRRGELLEQALFPEQVRRPWEVRFDALQERLLAAPGFDEVGSSPYRPVVALGAGELRPLDDFERVWVESLWGELHGLDALLVELRRLPLEDLEWHGRPVKLQVLRECVNALCARAWLAVERGEDLRAAESYADALRLARATDDETSWALMSSTACAWIALDSARSALDLGLSPRELRAALAPLLGEWSYSAERAERCIRRDLAALADFDPLQGAAWHDARGQHAWALDWLAPVEEALAIARRPVAATRWSTGEPRSTEQASSALEQWTLAPRHLHALHARRNVALTALAVAAFREEHGAWPSALDRIADLPGEHALDTLSGAPLAYSADESGARIGPASWGERVEGWPVAGESPYVWTLRSSIGP